MRIEFNIRNHQQKFDLINAHSRLIHVMWKSDESLIIIGKNKQVIMKEDEFPTSKQTYDEYFTSATSTTARNTRISVTMMMKTMKTFGEIKREDTSVYSYLMNQKIYIHPYKSGMTEHADIGCLFHLSQRLTWREDATKRIKEEVFNAMTEEEKSDVEKQTGKQCKSGEDFKLDLYPRVEGFGNGTGRVTTEIIAVISHPSYYLSIKDAIVRASEKKKIQGVFIPQGMSKTMSSIHYKNLLKSNTQYMERIRSVVILGITPKTMEKKEEEEKTLREKIMAIEGVNAVERTARSNDLGKYQIVTQHDKLSEVRRGLDEILSDEESSIQEEEKVEHLFPPRRTTRHVHHSSYMSGIAKLVQQEPAAYKNTSQRAQSQHKRGVPLEITYGKKKSYTVSMERKERINQGIQHLPWKQHNDDATKKRETREDGHTGRIERHGNVDTERIPAQGDRTDKKGNDRQRG